MPIRIDTTHPCTSADDGLCDVQFEGQITKGNASQALASLVDVAHSAEGFSAQQRVSVSLASAYAHDGASQSDATSQQRYFGSGNTMIFLFLYISDLPLGI